MAILGGDGAQDVLPSGVEGVAQPIHNLVIVAMGMVALLLGFAVSMGVVVVPLGLEAQSLLESLLDIADHQLKMVDSLKTHGISSSGEPRILLNERSQKGGAARLAGNGITARITIAGRRSARWNDQSPRTSDPVHS